jgi:hypothetical protein
MPTSGIKSEQPRVPERRSRHGPPISPPLDDGVIEPARAHVHTRSRAAAIAAGFFPRLPAADDSSLALLETTARADLLEVTDDRAGTRPTILITQLLVEHWHTGGRDPMISEAILDRLLTSEHGTTLTGESLCPTRTRSSRKGDSETEN